MGADCAAGVALVRDHPGRPGGRSPRTRAAELDPGQHRLEHGAVVDVPAGQHHRERPPVAVTRQMDLGCGAAAGPTDSMIIWLAVPLTEPAGPLCASR